jgi:uncharacterized protein (TIGR02466 family)
MNNLILLFPKVIYTNTLSSLTDDIIQYCKNKIDSDIITNGDGYGNYTKNQNFLDDPILNNVKEEILQFLHEYISVLNHETESIRVCSSWGNLLKPNDQTTKHNHANSYISGVFYLTDGSDIAFHNNSVSDDFLFLTKIHTEENKPWTYGKYTIPCSPKRIILFPSLLYHEIDKNVYHDRYSIAFNTIPVGNIGVDSCRIKL